MRDLTDRTATGQGRAGLRHLALAAAVLALGGCAAGARDDGYPSPYGPSRPTELPRVAGGGLWQPAPIRVTGTSSAALISSLPPEPRAIPPARSSQTPELLTPEQQAARQQELRTLRDQAPAAMDRRLQTQGRAPGDPRPMIPPMTIEE